MQDMAQLVATKTYQALVNADGPLATKAEFAKLDHRQAIQETQLSTIIKLLKSRTPEPKENIVAAVPTASSPLRNPKRTKPTLTPVRKNLCTEVFSTQSTSEPMSAPDFHMTSQSSDEDSVPSATSDPCEVMEGCED
jgi:hypothetical protein